MCILSWEPTFLKGEGFRCPPSNNRMVYFLWNWGLLAAQGQHSCINIGWFNFLNNKIANAYVHNKDIKQVGYSHTYPESVSTFYITAKVSNCIWGNCIWGVTLIHPSLLLTSFTTCVVLDPQEAPCIPAQSLRPEQLWPSEETHLEPASVSHQWGAQSHGSVSCPREDSTGFTEWRWYFSYFLTVEEESVLGEKRISRENELYQQR